MKIYQTLSCAFFCLFLHQALLGQTVPADLESKLDHTLDSMRTVVGAKAFSASIQFGDGAVWAHANGVSTAIPAVDVSTSDAFLIGSVTKTITSACVMKLADQGLLSLNDSLYKWLDTMPHINPNITIRQLLQHTSGIYDVLSHPHNQDSLMADMSRIWTPEELINRFISAPLFPAGTSWSYSNTNYFLLDMIIKKVTGNPFYSELRNKFFTPLGLGSFAIPAFEPLTAPVAHLWLDLNGDGIKDDANAFYMSYMSLNSTAGAAGGYFATPTDCTKWMRTYMRGDLLSPGRMAEARTVVFAPGAQGGYYGLGMMKNQTDFLGYLAYGHGGDLAYHASSWYFPLKDCSITVFTNDNDRNSWTLLPVVRELLRTYVNYLSVAVVDPEFENSLCLKAYPNPFTNQFIVSFQPNKEFGEYEVDLMDVTGRVIAHQIGKQTAGSPVVLSFNELQDLPGGSYFATLKFGIGRSKTILISK